MLNYLEYGKQDAPKLVIAHGLFGSGRNWGVIAKRLSDAYHVITPDMRNHGDSPREASHSYPDMAADLAELIAHIGGPVDLIGHSMGGKAAMVTALNHPESIRRLMVADIAPVGYDHTQNHFIDAMRSVDLSRVTRRSDANAQLADAGVAPALQSFFTQSLDAAGKRWKLNLNALEANMDAIIGFPEVDATFDGLTLFLTGGQSDYVLPEHRPTIKARFPNARFAKLSKAGHWLHADDPRGFEQTLRVFLGAEVI